QQDVLSLRDDFLAGSIPSQEQTAFEAMRLSSAERQGIEQELRQMTGASLPERITLQTALALVAPAMADVNLTELLPTGFSHARGPDRQAPGPTGEPNAPSSITRRNRENGQDLLVEIRIREAPEPEPRPIRTGSGRSRTRTPQA